MSFREVIDLCFAAAGVELAGGDDGNVRADTAIFHQLLDTVAIGVLFWEPERPDDPDGMRLTFINRVGCEWLSLDRAQSLGKTMGELFPKAVPERTEAILRVAVSGKPHDFGVINW